MAHASTVSGSVELRAGARVERVAPGPDDVWITGRDGVFVYARGRGVETVVDGAPLTVAAPFRSAPAPDAVPDDPDVVRTGHDAFAALGGRRRRPSPFAYYGVFAAIVAVGGCAVAPSYVLPVLTMLIVGVVALAWWIDRTSQTRLAYDADAPSVTANLALTDALGAALTTPDNVWEVERMPVPRGGGRPTWRRRVVQCVVEEPGTLPTNVRPWQVVTPQARYAWLPDGLAVFEHGAWSWTAYEALLVEVSHVDCVEPRDPANDFGRLEAMRTAGEMAADSFDAKQSVLRTRGRFTVWRPRGHALDLVTSAVEPAYAAASVLGRLGARSQERAAVADEAKSS